jgi:diadenosine tetraphosphatase ApaH/serine/threonine PP2A family protein phosphatase
VKVAVISDVHGNLPALEATLADIDADGADELWCLGDLTGYGGDPGPCLEIVLDRADVCLAGNHDMVITGEIRLDAFSHDARAAAEWTMGVLAAGQLRRLAELSPSGERHDVQLNHGSIRDPVWEYVIDDRTAAICIEHQTSPLSMVGHSHVPLSYGYADGTFIGGLAPAGTEMVVKPGPFLLNPGSVGQPRDGDPRAAYMTVDLATGTVRWRRVEYDVAAAQRAIQAAGLPLRLGLRLAEGY